MGLNQLIFAHSYFYEKINDDNEVSILTDLSLEFVPFEEFSRKINDRLERMNDRQCLYSMSGWTRCIYWLPMKLV